MTTEEYRRAKAIAHRACRGWPLSKQDWEDIEQAAAIAAWKGGTGTHIYWAAWDEGTRLQGGRRKIQPTLITLGELQPRAPDDVEADALERITLDELKARMPERHWRSVAGTVIEDRSWAEVSASLGTCDGTVSRWRRAGLEQIKTLLG